MDLAERCCYPYLNHVVLCNSVYPKTPGHEGPNQANLSRLLFYASSRPHKLPKIGRYIEARAKKDFYAARIGYVKITLTILEAIVQRCTDHLGLFLPYALSTLDEVVGTADLDLVIVATGAFTSLSRHIDYPSLLLSPDLSRQWMTLVKKYADMCESETGGKDARHRFRLSGLKALESLLASESLALTPGTETYVKVALPAAMKNMAVIPPDVEVDGLADEVAKTDANGGKEPPSLPPHHSIADDLITDAELSKIAERCAAEAAARIGATQGGARLVVGEVVAYLDSAPLWSRPPLVQHILHVLLHNLRPPHRALLAALVSSRLARSPPVPPAAIDALLAILTESIRTSSDAAPLAAMEALDAVSRGVGRAAAVVAGEASSEDMAGALPVAEAAAAAEGVAGAVARAVAEKNAGEVVGFLANRVRAAGIGKESSLAGRETRKVGMRCLVRVAREAGKVGGKGTVPMEVVEGMAAFVNDGEADTRVEFAKFLVEVLAPSPGSATESPLSPTPTHSLFVSDLLRRLHTQTLDSRSTPADYAAARAVLEAVAEGFEGGEGEAAGTAMQIQDDSLSRLSTLPSHLRAANGVVVAFFSRLARARRLEALRSHVEDVRRRREGKGEWPVGWDVEADSDSWGKMLGQLSSLERASGAALSPVSILVSREVVVEALGPVQGLPAAPSKATERVPAVTDTAPVRLKLAPAKKAAGVGAVVNVDTLRDALAEDAIPDNLSESDSQAGMVNPHSVALTSRTAGSSAGRSTPPVGAGGAVLGVNGTASDHLSAPGSVGSLGSRKLGKPALSAEALNVLNALAPSPGAPQLRTRLGIPNGVVSATSLATTEEMELVMKKTTVQVQPVTIPNMEVSGSNGGRPPLMI